MKEKADSVYIQEAFSSNLLSLPGTKFEYSNFGYFLLADIIRIVSNQSFSDYMQQSVFRPCGLDNTQATSEETLITNRAAGYMKNALGTIINAPNMIAMRPSGAFLSTVVDLLKWEIAMQNNQLLTQKYWSQVTTDTVKTPHTMDNEVIFYGYGWMTNKINGKQFVHHGGSLPGFKSAYFRYPEDKTAIIILTNSENADAYGMAFGVSDLLQTVANHE